MSSFPGMGAKVNQESKFFELFWEIFMSTGHETEGPRDLKSTRPKIWVHETEGPRDRRSTRPKVHETEESHETEGPRDRRSTRPKQCPRDRNNAHETEGPRDRNK
jgi:hypothetical protein